MQRKPRFVAAIVILVPIALAALAILSFWLMPWLTDMGIGD
ncbi:MAG: hypothetical protein AAGI68_02255 [Planctomycetota bacterium]